MNRFRKIITRIAAVAIAAVLVGSMGVFTETGNFIGTNISVSAAKTTPVSSFEYETNSEGNITITKFIGSETKVVIPKKIDEKTVTVIGEDAFYGCTKLTSVTLSSGIKIIDRYAFSRCEKLQGITFPASVKEIKESAFRYCSSITSVTIPDTVEILGADVFYSCSSLSEINVPNNAKFSVGDAFDDTKWYKDQPDGDVYLGDSYYRYKGEMPKNTKVTVKKGTRAIAHKAFWECDNLTSVSLPDSLKIIESLAFDGCTSLTSVNIPNGVTLIDALSFSGCKGLKSVTISETVEKVGYASFWGCPNMTSVTILGSKTYIDNQAFGYYSEFDENHKLQTRKVVNLKIYGKADSTAEKYANIRSFAFMEMIGNSIVGDVNGDGKINIADALQISRYDAGLAKLTKTQLSLSDVNKDGKYNIADALVISRYDAGLVEKLK